MITRKLQPKAAQPLSARRLSDATRIDVFRRRRVRLAAYLLLALAAASLFLLPASSPPSAAARRARDSACKGWDPLALPSADPPRCRRARQLRQLQRFLDNPEWK